MRELNNFDGLENAFHNKIEGQSMALPPSVWQNVKMVAMESQLVKLQSNNSLLKYISGFLGAALIGTAFLFLQKKESKIKVPQIVTITKTDTLYIDKIKKEYVTVYIPIKETNQFAVENSSIGKENVGTINSEIPFDLKLDELKGGSPLTNFNGDLNRLNALTDTHNPIGQYVTNNTQVADNQIFKLNNLAPIAHKTEIVQMEIPKLNIKSTQIPITKKPIEIPKEPIKNRFTIATYFMPELNNLIINRKERVAFDYANEGVRSSNTFGLRAGMQLNSRLTLLTGVEYSNLSFDEFDKVQTFSAENFNGTPSFLYKHAVGTIVIPNSKLASLPIAGDKLQVGINEPISSLLLKTTIGLKYAVLSGNFARNKNFAWNIYGISAATINLPMKQEIKLDVFQNNVIARFDIKKIENQRSFVGLNLGFGLAVKYGKNIGLFIEPSFSKSLSSLVNEKSFTTHLTSFGLKTGVFWHFDKNKKK